MVGSNPLESKSHIIFPIGLTFLIISFGLIITWTPSFIQPTLTTITPGPVTSVEGGMLLLWGVSVIGLSLFIAIIYR